MNAFITEAQTQPMHQHTSELSVLTLVTPSEGGWLTLRAVGKNYFSNYKMCLAQRLSAPLCADGISHLTRQTQASSFH